MKRFAVDALPGSGLEPLSEAASHHAVRVCRLAEGAEITLFDGTGHEVIARIEQIADGLAQVRALGPPRRVDPPTAVHLVLGLPKGPAADDAVRMATEAGATEIHPVWAARTQGRPDRLDRWRKIAESAAAQCGRADVPQVHGPASLAQALDRLEGTPLWIALPGAEPTSDPSGAVLIGPEGGWSPAEIDQALGRGANALGLGPWVLRTPTAAAIAVARLGSGPSN